jgi:hypothetical protein
MLKKDFLFINSINIEKAESFINKHIVSHYLDRLVVNSAKIIAIERFFMTHNSQDIDDDFTEMEHITIKFKAQENVLAMFPGDSKQEIKSELWIYAFPPDEKYASRFRRFYEEEEEEHIQIKAEYISGIYCGLFHAYEKSQGEDDDIIAEVAAFLDVIGVNEYLEHEGKFNKGLYSSAKLAQEEQNRRISESPYEED